MSNITVCALYKFVALPNFKEIKPVLLKFMLDHDVRGTLLLAHEGINGTVAAQQKDIDALLAWLDTQPGLEKIVYKLSYNESNPFNRTKVKLKKEIVTLGVEGLDPEHVTGTYVKPKDWNDLISDPDVTVVDTRNDYEVQIGTFEGAINPNTKTFREFPEYVKEKLDPQKHKKVAMFCTGGIRCEKSTAYLMQQGFEEVYHLEGGILKYLEEVPQKDSKWEGDCFVFDGRVAVKHGLNKSDYDQCFACRMPISEEEKMHKHYEKGISCPHCYAKQTELRKARFKEREKQSELAKARGEEHIGMVANKVIKQRRQDKKVIKAEQRALQTQT